jgi:argininosuccinate lyase
MAYDRDLQEDKRSLWASLELLASVTDVLPPLLSRVDVDERRALDAFRDGFALATDVAEYLVARGVPFREAHQKVGQAVKWCLERGRALNSLSVEEWKVLIPEVEADLIGLLVPEAAVERRRTFGGTAFAEVRRQIKSGKGRLEKALSEFEVYRECALEALLGQVFTFSVS